MLALSIRQPWAWCVANGWKPIENRSWRTCHRDVRVLIHAGKQLDDHLAHALEFIESQGVPLPPIDKLERGGIVGAADLTDCICGSSSPWFFGEFGFVFANAKPLPFRPVAGRLSFFDLPGFTE